MTHKSLPVLVHHSLLPMVQVMELLSLLKTTVTSIGENQDELLTEDAGILVHTTPGTQISLNYLNTLITYFIYKDILMHKKHITLYKSFVFWG